ncbi:hypothetical protein DY000_02014349 [Brassica cretica]|uniref:Uncharacterized protein n=1 Tax=Brassica cretica TaxID=69181 RepID=A0ABQ7DAQ0_BRACR|nr:hypothetical protein DY000_02014349 [Brassica cretica]
MRADTKSPVWLDITGQRVRERKKVVDLRVWSILKSDTPPRRPLPSNRRFSTIVTRKLCPIQSVQGQSVPLMMKWSPKNCPGAKGRSVQISLSRPIRFFMVKPRFCPSQDQSIPVQSRRSSWGGFVPVIFKDSVVAGGRTIWGIFGHIGRSPSCDVGTTGVFCLRSFLGIVCQVLCRQKVLTLSPKSGLGTGFGLVCILFPLLEARSWQEAKSNLVTVALGKDDQIAWCWTLGPPV